MESINSKGEIAMIKRLITIIAAGLMMISLSLLLGETEVANSQGEQGKSQVGESKGIQAIKPP